MTICLSHVICIYGSQHMFTHYYIFSQVLYLVKLFEDIFLILTWCMHYWSELNVHCSLLLMYMGCYVLHVSRFMCSDIIIIFCVFVCVFMCLFVCLFVCQKLCLNIAFCNVVLHSKKSKRGFCVFMDIYIFCVTCMYLLTNE